MTNIDKTNTGLWFVRKVCFRHVQFKSLFDYELWNSKEYSEERRFIESLIEDMISYRSPREIEILHARMQGKSLEEIGWNYRVTRERIRQILEKSLDKLRKDPELRNIRNEIIQYLEDDGVILNKEIITREDLYPNYLSKQHNEHILMCNRNRHFINTPFVFY